MENAYTEKPVREVGVPMALSFLLRRVIIKLNLIVFVSRNSKKIMNILHNF